MITLHSPIREELRTAFKEMNAGDQMLVYGVDRNRLNSRVNTYCLKASVRLQDDGGFLVTCKEPRQDKLQLREQMARLDVQGAIPVAERELEAFLQATRLFRQNGSTKVFKLRPLDDGSQEIVRVA